MEPLIGFLLRVERIGDAMHDVLRHRRIDLAGQLDEPRVLPELARFPSEIKRVDRDAVSAETRARDKTA